MKIPAWDLLPENMKNDVVKYYYDIIANKKLSLNLKRALDVCGSAGLLTALSPVLAGIAAWIKLDSPGPAIYSQERVTSFGRHFNIKKFRTMVTGADKIGSLVTVNEDPRITSSGKFLRKFRLDELPQLINVLRGEMSFVGTRPEVPKYVEAYTPEMLATLLMPAGVTSQTSIKYKDEEKLLKASSDADSTYINEILPQKMQYNLESLRNFSFLNDIKTMVQTVFAVLRPSDEPQDSDGQEPFSNPFRAGGRPLNFINTATGSVKVSVVMPVYMEEKYIADCIDSLLQQDYPLGSLEYIFVDGCSTDKTAEIISSYAQRLPGKIILLKNPHKTVPYAMNIGIEHASGEYIVRLDAHAQYDSDYISKCVQYLESTGAANVGGTAQTKSHGYMGAAIAAMLSSRFGVGNSEFRTGGSSGYVDTVPFGAFRREVFELIGGYDERLTRNQDNEMNWRIRKNGGRIYLADDIRFSYYCRDTVKGIAKMALQNGRWNVITMKLCPGSMGIRHFIPLLFTGSLIGVPAAACAWKLISGSSLLWRFFAAEIAAYALSDLIFSIKDAPAKYLPAVAMLFPVFHISYGLGSVRGLLSLGNL